LPERFYSSAEYASELDRGGGGGDDDDDELARLRERFHRPAPINGRPVVYLDGNSLGLCSYAAEASILRVIEQWKALGVEGWTRADPPWFTLAEHLGRRVAPLVGAASDEVIVTNSTTVNLHQLLGTLYRPAAGRTKILSDVLSFPSDSYAIQSFLASRGPDPTTHLVRVPSRDGLLLDDQDIFAALTSDDVCLAVLPGVLFTSGQLLDMARITRFARDRGVLIGWDCSHSIGAVPHALDEWDADFAFWCSYKYLCAGPGAVGGLYLNRRHFGRPPALAGWFSSRKDVQFDMALDLTPAPDAGAMQIGTPHVLSMAALDGALDLIHEAGIDRLRAKSLRLTRYLIDLVDSELTEHGFSIATPRDDARRGGHVALVHDDATRIAKALRAEGVIPDFRPPRIIRLAPVALYTSFVDCHEAVARLKAIMTTRSYERQPTARDMVS
jgi:kynureninase